MIYTANHAGDRPFIRRNVPDGPDYCIHPDSSASSDALDKLNEVRVNYLGKKGELTAVLKGMKDVAAEERPKVGQLVNETREEIERGLEETVPSPLPALPLPHSPYR